jgi:hypothetical protein
MPFGKLRFAFIGHNRAFIDAEYTRAFVTTQYYGYLRRDGDLGGLLFWQRQVNRFPLRDTTVQTAMVCSFITPTEYQQRFSSVFTHGNASVRSRVFRTAQEGGFPAEAQSRKEKLPRKRAKYVGSCAAFQLLCFLASLRETFFCGFA